MKWFLLVSMLFSSGALAAPKFYMGLNAGKGSALWLDQRSVGGKKIQTLGFRSSENKVLERALPASEYQRIASAMQTWMTAKDQRRIAMAGPGCVEAVLFEANSKMKFVCFDRVSKANKVKFSRWYTDTVHTALGIF